MNDQDFINLFQNEKVIKKSIHIDKKYQIEETIETLKEKYKNYIEVLKQFKLQFSLDLNSVLQEYKSSIFETLWFFDDKSQIEHKASLNPEKYMEDWAVKNSLTTNPKIQQAFFELEGVFRVLGLSLEDGWNYTLEVEYYSFEGTSFVNFISEDLPNFIKNCELFMDRYKAEQINKPIISNIELQMVWDTINNKEGVRYYDWCERKRVEGNTKFYKIEKTEKYWIGL